MTTDFPDSPAASHLIRVTRAVSFGTFTVPSGIDAHTALEEISMLLDRAAQAAFETCDNAAVPAKGLLRSSLRSIDAAKAIADALLAGAERIR
jgi:hypothetical protein